MPLRQPQRAPLHGPKALCVRRRGLMAVPRFVRDGPSCPDRRLQTRILAILSLILKALTTAARVGTIADHLSHRGVNKR